jgi:hypothetical protein
MDSLQTDTKLIEEGAMFSVLRQKYYFRDIFVLLQFVNT